MAEYNSIVYRYRHCFPKLIVGLESQKILRNFEQCWDCRKLWSWNEFCIPKWPWASGDQWQNVMAWIETVPIGLSARRLASSSWCYFDSCRDFMVWGLGEGRVFEGYTCLWYQSLVPVSCLPCSGKHKHFPPMSSALPSTLWCAVTLCHCELKSTFPPSIWSQHQERD